MFVVDGFKENENKEEEEEEEEGDIGGVLMERASK